MSFEKEHSNFGFIFLWEFIFLIEHSLMLTQYRRIINIVFIS